MMKRTTRGRARIFRDKLDRENLIGPIGHAYGVEKVPESFLIDRDGIVRYYLVNKRDWNNAAARTCLRSVLDG